MQKQSDPTYQHQSIASFNLIPQKVHPKFLQMQPKEIVDTSDIYFDNDLSVIQEDDVVSFSIRQFEPQEKSI
jgi:hypothetical protein